MLAAPHVSGPKSGHRHGLAHKSTKMAAAREQSAIAKVKALLEEREWKEAARATESRVISALPVARVLRARAFTRLGMRDEALAPARDFPLYWKGGATQDEFAVGVLLLQRDVQQLLFSQGVAGAEAHMLGSLQRLFVLLLDAPLPSAVDADA